ncbi:MAG: enoyl-CoA hydratase/isomerase family protein [Saprospiraceae bacterium]|nr:enoyl-CoA hydratase/isomerase family protein [Saprospiraceae bacterium]
MNYQYLIFEQKDNALIITLNRPEALNAINTHLMKELNNFFNRDIDNYRIKGIIIQGSGEKAFAAGADIKEFEGLSAAQAEIMSTYGQETYFAIEKCKIPVIAVIKGFALGGGCELAMACHLRVGGPKARFGQPEVNLGLPPGYGATQRLVQLIGRSKALEMLLTTDMVDVTEAYRLGLVNYIANENEELSLALKIVEKLATKSPIGIQKVIECVNAYSDKEKDGYYAEAAAFGVCAGTEDFKEGALAFVEKRKPIFNGK